MKYMSVFVFVSGGENGGCVYYAHILLISLEYTCTQSGNISNNGLLWRELRKKLFPSALIKT